MLNGVQQSKILALNHNSENTLKTLYPTGSCFDDALEFIEGLIKHKRPLYGLTVVHALCFLPDDAAQIAEGMGKPNEPYAHAWVEDDADDQCIFAAILDGEKAYFASPRDEFYKNYNVSEFTRYTLEQVNELNKKHLNYGPWEEPYLSYTKEAKNGS